MTHCPVSAIHPGSEEVRHSCGYLSFAALAADLIRLSLDGREARWGFQTVTGQVAGPAPPTGPWRKAPTGANLRGIAANTLPGRPACSPVVAFAAIDDFPLSIPQERPAGGAGCDGKSGSRLPEHQDLVRVAPVVTLSIGFALPDSCRRPRVRQADSCLARPGGD